MKLIYVMDPHCGWCYGTSSSLEEVIKEKNITTEILPGGMWLGERAPQGGVEFSKFIQEHSPTMEQRTGAEVGEGFHALVQNSDYIFSSLEPSAAIQAVRDIKKELSVSFAKKLQEAIFKQGNRPDVGETYIPILEELEIPVSEFQDTWMTDENIQKTQAVFEKAKNLSSMFPTIFLEKDENIHMLVRGFYTPEQLSAVIDEYI